MSSPQFHDPLVGQIIDDRYQILDRIGEGGMGVVYKARQTSIDRMVAIKMLNQQMAQDPNWVQRFNNEAKACSQLQHPNTIRMFEFGQTRDGRLFMAMEFLDGKALRDVISEGPMHPARVIKVLIQCCASLAEAHSIGIIHRDIKPDNVFLLSMPGSPDFVKVLDFSVAKLLQNDGMRTQAGVVFGTPQYMSPEQGRGLPLDARSDLYALGILAYEMLTQDVPFNHDNPMMVLQMHLRDPVRPLPGHIPPPVQAVVMRALDKDTNTRYQSASEMMQHCQEVFNQLSGLAPAPQMGGGAPMGGPQMGGAARMAPGMPPAGAPPAAGPPPGGFNMASDAGAKTMIAGAPPPQLQAILQQQQQQMQQPPHTAEAKTMIAGAGPGFAMPNLPPLSSAGMPGGGMTGGMPGGMPGGGMPGGGMPGGMPGGGMPGGFPPPGGGAAPDDDGPPKTIMLQDSEGIVSMLQNQREQTGSAQTLPPPGGSTGTQVNLDDEEGASVLYWAACLSGGLVVGVVAYVMIRLFS